MLLEIGRSLDRVVLERHTLIVYTLYAYRNLPRCVGLTTELSGRPQPPLRIGEHAIHCEHDGPTMIRGPLQRVVRCHSQLVLRDVERVVEDPENVDTSVSLD